MNLHKLVNEERPAIIPSGWKPVPNYPAGAIYTFTLSNMAIMYSVSETDDGKKYHHISFSREDRIPSWEEMRDSLYDLPWLDKGREIFMTLPPKSQYVSLPDSKVMHWWQEIVK